MDLKFRQQQSGPETNLVNRFLQGNELLLDKSLIYEVLIEPYAEVGAPDILIVGWSKENAYKWPPERFKLKKDEIKLLHFISTHKSKGVRLDDISTKLGLTPRKVDHFISKLDKAGLIESRKCRYFVKNFNQNFIVRQIITIEAKIKNWKDAFSQAQLNENFATHSYVLIPEETYNENVKNWKNGKIGLITQEGIISKVRKKARKGSLPSSYYSWIINEYIGRNCSVA
jgi:predicted transcriptional regulator